MAAITPGTTSTWRTAGEAELYRDRFSLSGLAGVEGINGTAADNSHFFGLFDFAYYPMDDVKLSAGFDYVNETGMGTAGVDYLMHHGTTPISLFAKGRFGASDYQSITAGVRVHFGADPNATLIARNRIADPDNYVPVFQAVSGPTCARSARERVTYTFTTARRLVRARTHTAGIPSATDTSAAPHNVDQAPAEMTGAAARHAQRPSHFFLPVHRPRVFRVAHQSHELGPETKRVLAACAVGKRRIDCQS